MCGEKEARETIDVESIVPLLKAWKRNIDTLYDLETSSVGIVVLSFSLLVSRGDSTAQEHNI